MADFYKIRDDHFWNRQENNGLILFSDLCCLQCSGSYTIAYVFDGRSFRLSYCLGKVIKKMKAPDFIRTHQTFYAGLKHVLRMEKRKDQYKGSFILYPNNVEIKCLYELEKPFENLWIDYILRQKLNGGA